MSKRIRRVGSIKRELLKKSREAALAAVQIFNNPNISFKSESYVVLMIIAWTYLLHAYFRDQKSNTATASKTASGANSIRPSMGPTNTGSLNAA